MSDGSAARSDIRNAAAPARARRSRTAEAIAHAKAHRQDRSTVTIDGNPITVPLGTTILEAARQLGIRIPTLCYHEDLCLAGVCRMCVVEIEGQRTLQAACSYPITAPIQVQHPHGQGPPGPAAHPRPAAGQPLRRVLHLRPQQQLRAAGAGHGVRRRFLPLRPPRQAALRDRRLEPLRGPRHEQVRALPPLHPHLHRPAGGRRAGGHRPRQPHQGLAPSWTSRWPT